MADAWKKSILMADDNPLTIKARVSVTVDAAQTAPAEAPSLCIPCMIKAVLGELEAAHKEDCGDPPLDCQKAWAEVDKEAVRIVNSTDDAVERNKKISAAYAQMYLDDPRMQWIGTAAFASKQVGCGLHQAGEWGLIGRPVYDMLESGNKAVFQDIFPVHRFYQKHGMAGLRCCASSRPPQSANGEPGVDNDTMAGFEQIDKGDYGGAALSIAKTEQQGILQSKAGFGSSLGARMEMRAGQLLRIAPVKTAFTAACEGTPSVDFKGSNIADIGERWPYAQKVVGKFGELIKSEDSAAQIRSELGKIVANGQQNQDL